ncbi:MAG: SDR family oxidoreductase [Candidatus Sumerlaeia bacterium]|nr:SDR family oxidoreductase [Candidatus Sumerlaeia bacterium]
MEDRLILVTGATGYIGGRLVTALRKEGWKVRAMVRDPRKAKKRSQDWDGVEVVRGDVSKPATLVKALKGVSAAYYLVHSMTVSSRDFEARDLLGAENFASACETAGVERIIYLGGICSSERKLSSHLESRRQTGEALRSTSVPVTELRAAIIVGSGSASFEIIRDCVSRLPMMITPKWVRSKCEPIGIRQMLGYMVGCLDEPRTIGEILEVGGGEVLTYKEMLHQAAEEMGRKVKILTVPLLTPKLSAYWLNLVTSVPFRLALPLAEGLSNDVVCTDFRIREWIKVEPMTFRQTVRLALDRERAGTRETRWTDAAFGALMSFPGKEKKHFRDQRVYTTEASPESLFTVIESIGGKNRWFYGDWLWSLRGALDSILGGVGMRRGRVHPSRLQIGEPLDFWRVDDLEPGRLLVLRAEMKVPGIARLVFRIQPREDGDGSFLLQTAHFWPNGTAGVLYWWAVAPFHRFVFPGMAKGIIRQAERLDRFRAVDDDARGR